MSLALVESEIERFLSSVQAEVICIRGKWGVGKTYAWNKLLSRAGSAKKVALKSYAYVSLFGLTSLDHLKYSIFENTVAVADVGIEATVETFQSNTDAVVKRLGRKSLSFLRGAPIVGDYASALQSLSFLSVRETIVCIDDLERKSDELAMKDVLGLVAHLRDQKRCKVVLILNDDSLDGDDRKNFDKFNEKVIDRSLEYAPNATDCARIALSGEGPVQEHLRKATVSLAISNIRIVKKIERYATDVAQLVSKFDASVLRQALQSTVVFGWSVYSKDAPSIDFLRHKRGKALFGLMEEGELTPEEVAWSSLLDEIGFISVDDFDLVLLEGIRRGFFEESAVVRGAEELDRRAKAVKSEDSIRAAWRSYHDSFDANEQQVVEALLNAYRAEIGFVSPASLDGIVSLLRALSRKEEAMGMISYFMENRKEDRRFYDLSDYAFGDEVSDPDVRSAFSLKYQSFPDNRSPVEVLLHIARRDSWSRDDKVLLAKITTDDLYKMFKAQRGDDLSMIVHASLQFERIGGIDAELKEVSARAK